MSAAFAARLFASHLALAAAVFLTREFWTPGQQAEACVRCCESFVVAKRCHTRPRADGIEALRYAHAREAAVHADRPQQRAHVRVRADGLRLRPYRQRASGHRLRRAVPAAAPP